MSAAIKKLLRNSLFVLDCIYSSVRKKVCGLNLPLFFLYVMELCFPYDNPCMHLRHTKPANSLACYRLLNYYIVSKYKLIMDIAVKQTKAHLNEALSCYIALEN